MTARTAAQTLSTPRVAPAPPRSRPTRPVARFRIRVTSGETIAVGPGKIALLEAIKETHSITAAAKSIRMSYRRAWILIDDLNHALKRPAVMSAIGGKAGGNSELTEVGETLISVYRRIEEQAAQACADDIAILLKLVR